MEALIAARAAVLAAIDEEREIALGLRDAGHSWDEIGAAVGLSSEGARSRYTTTTANGRRERLPLEPPLPGVSIADYAKAHRMSLRVARAGVEDGSIPSVAVVYRGRQIKRVIP